MLIGVLSQSRLTVQLELYCDGDMSEFMVVSEKDHANEIVNGFLDMRQVGSVSFEIGAEVDVSCTQYACHPYISSYRYAGRRPY